MAAKDDEVRMYLIVNESLGMSKGKMCGQVGHGVSRIVRRLERMSRLDLDCKQWLEYYDRWCAFGEPKIVLKANEATLNSILADLPAVEIEIVRDEGRTQIAPNSFTVLGILPKPSSTLPPVLNTLKLL